MCKYCITDMIRAQEGGDMERTNVVIQNWMRLKDTIEFLGFWEQLSNPKFNCIEFEAIKASAGTNRFILTAKEWCSRTGAIGICSPTSSTSRPASSKGSHIIPQPSAICKNCKKERARTRERRLIISNP